MSKLRKTREAWSVDPRFAAGLPFPVPEIPEFVAFRDSANLSSNFPGAFPEFSSGTPEQTPKAATAFSSFLKNASDFAVLATAKHVKSHSQDCEHICTRQGNQKFREGGIVGGKHGPIWQKCVFPCFIGFSHPRETSCGPN